MGKTCHDLFPYVYDYLSPLHRSVLHRALNGDSLLMAKLLSDWDVDAQLLEHNGLSQVKRLSRSQYVRAQYLSRKLRESPKIMRTEGQFLPQTYASATYLLALTHPKEIFALPQGFRAQNALFSSEYLNQVPRDFNPNALESMLKQPPAVAFVANYSHPSLVEALRTRGVTLIQQNDVFKLEEIHQTLSTIGTAIHREDQAELLSLFIEAALIAIDNRLMARYDTLAYDEQPLRALYLNYYAQFCVPSACTPTGQLFQRLKHHTTTQMHPMMLDTTEWIQEMEHEEIIDFNPDILFLALRTPLESIPSHPGFSDLSAVKHGHVFFVDETLHQSPTQSIVLAYFDLAQVLVRSHDS